MLVFPNSRLRKGHNEFDVKISLGRYGVTMGAQAMWNATRDTLALELKVTAGQTEHLMLM